MTDDPSLNWPMTHSY